MELKYDTHADAASVVVSGPVPRGGVAFTKELDQDRNIRYDADDRVIEYEFHHVRRHGVKVDDLEHRDALRALFRAAGFSERDWSTPIPTRRRVEPPRKTAEIVARWKAQQENRAAG